MKKRTRGKRSDALKDERREENGKEHGAETRRNSVANCPSCTPSAEEQRTVKNSVKETLQRHFRRLMTDRKGRHLCCASTPSPSQSRERLTRPCSRQTAQL